MLDLCLSISISIRLSTLELIIHYVSFVFSESRRISIAVSTASTSAPSKKRVSSPFSFSFNKFFKALTPFPQFPISSSVTPLASNSALTKGMWTVLLNDLILIIPSNSPGLSGSSILMFFIIFVFLPLLNLHLSFCHCLFSYRFSLFFTKI